MALRHTDDDRVKPEQDRVTCSIPRCDRAADVATPAGPLCREHARGLANDRGDDPEGDR